MVRIYSLILAVLSTVVVSAQNVRVSGTVSGNDGTLLGGVAVIVDGTNSGTITDVDGYYTLDVPANAVLVFSCIGYETVSEAVNGRDVVNVTLVEDALLLEDVIVVAYGTASRAAFTGSASQMKGEEVANLSKQSIDKGMMGKFAGVRVASATGDPGSEGSVQIRGVGSISASNSPLYVVDGVIMSQATEMTTGGKSFSVMSTLNPDDIESITILKDAAAASLYGSRAANGVIVITTKRGRVGDTRISYSAEVSATSLANNKAFQMMSGPQYIQYITDAVNNANDLGGSYSLSEYLSVLADPTGATSTNWRDEVFRTAISHNHQVSMTTGTEKTQVYASLGYNDTQGVVIGSYFERLSGRLNVDHNVKDWLKISLRQMISFSKNKGHSDQSDQVQGMGYSTPLGLLGSSDPTATVRNADGSWNEDVSLNAYGTNPHLFFDSDRQYVLYNTMRSLSNIDVDIRFSKKVSLKNTFGYDYLENKESAWYAPSTSDGAATSGYSSKYIFEMSDLTNSTTLRYVDNFGVKHHLSALAGFEVSDHREAYTFAASTNFPSDDFPALSAGQPYDTAGEESGSFMLSILASANYDYEDKYYVSASFRRDGSSKLGPDNRWANFWSISGAWRVTEEDFMKTSNLFRELKLKGSYGTNGNLPAGYYEWIGLYSYTGGYGSESAIYWSSPENSELGWEMSQNFNVGFEWNVLGKVQLEVEYYNKYTSSLLFDMPSSAVTGFDSYTTNVGNLKNNGIELQLSSLNVSKRNFSWTTDFNFTWQRSVVKNLPNDGADISYGDGNMYLHREGESMYTFYLPVWVGVNSETGLGEFLIDPSDPSKGTTNYYTEAGSGIVGKALPDFVGGITNSFNFCKHFDFSFLISYQFGGDLFDYPGYFFTSDGFRAGRFVNYASSADYWTPENTDAEYPMPIVGNPYRSDRFSSRHIKSTDNIRVREVTLGYNVPIKKYVQNFRVYFKASNPLMIWSATPDIDPDVAINGYRTVDVPATKSFVFGLNVTF